MNDDLTRRAREWVHHSMGADFAAKATNALCRALAGMTRTRLRGAGPAAVRPVVELEEQPLPAPGHAEVAAQLRRLPGWVDAVRGARELLSTSGLAGLAARVDALLDPVARLRDLHVREMRERCYRAMGPIVDHIRHAMPGAPAFPGARLMAGPPGDVCWLNQTIRTGPVATASPLDRSAMPAGDGPRRAAAARLADVAADPRVRGFRVSGRLRAELSVTSQTVGAAQHRAAHHCGGRGVVVGVLDSEVSRSHPAFGDRVVHRMNYTREPWGHPGKHGTAMAGIIGAAGPDLFGMAPEAVIYNYKVLTCGSGFPDAADFDLARALQQALEDGVHIANCSLCSASPPEHTERLVLACDNAWALGMTIVKSAGNTGPERGTVTEPAGRRGVIVVGATGRDGLGVERYSARGPVAGKEACCPDLVAPGGGPGDPVESCLPCGGFGPTGCGTSQAAAHVSGVLALLLEAEPGLTPDEQRTRLLALCDDSVQGGEDAEGRGIVRLAPLRPPPGGGQPAESAGTV
ncbi:MAG TPA: S8 family serine peptidase [Longimicrobium sp.]|nr:S8 family serine peptidase [Longimicrobium sp.]